MEVGFHREHDVLPNSSENMACRKGVKFFEAEEFPVDSVYNVLDKVCKVPSRSLRVSTCVLISGFYKIKGVCDVLLSRKHFLPTHTAPKGLQWKCTVTIDHEWRR